MTKTIAGNIPDLFYIVFYPVYIYIYIYIYTVLPQIMAQVFISFWLLFTPAIKRDQRLLVEVLNQSFSGCEF